MHYSMDITLNEELVATMGIEDIIDWRHASLIINLQDKFFFFLGGGGGGVSNVRKHNIS
jgi:hypothetical protein